MAVLKEKEVSVTRIKILYGNQYEPVNTQGKNKHRWTVFVDLDFRGHAMYLFNSAADLIERVIHIQ